MGPGASGEFAVYDGRFVSTPGAELDGIELGGIAPGGVDAGGVAAGGAADGGPASGGRVGGSLGKGTFEPALGCWSRGSVCGSSVLMMGSFRLRMSGWRTLRPRRRGRRGFRFRQRWWRVPRCRSGMPTN
jgi:hypothetical protein